MFPIFCVLAGVDDLRNNWATSNVVRAIILNGVCYCILLFSQLPTEAVVLHHWLWRVDNWLWGTAKSLLFGSDVGLDVFQLQAARISVINGFHAKTICQTISWWALAISTWKAFGWLARKCHAPRWLLPLAACTMHFVSGWGTSFPFERLPKRNEKVWWWLPTLKSPGGLTEFWIYYAAAPFLLPTRFPLELPRMPLSAPLETLLRHQVQPRLFWPLLAVLLYMHGCLVAYAPASWWNFLNWMPWAPLLRLYQAGYLVGKSSPMVAITSKSYAKYIPAGQTQVWTLNLAVLNLCGLVRESCARACVCACVREQHTQRTAQGPCRHLHQRD